MKEILDIKSIKTAFAVLLCMLVFQGLHREYPFYACIAAVICMQGGPDESVTIGKNRMIGTFVGGTVGYLVSLLHMHSILLTAIGIVIVASICQWIHKNGSASIACIVFLAIMTNLKGTAPHVYAINRMIDTYIGILLAVLVNKGMIIERTSQFLQGLKQK